MIQYSYVEGLDEIYILLSIILDSASTMTALWLTIAAVPRGCLV